MCVQSGGSSFFVDHHESYDPDLASHPPLSLASGERGSTYLAGSRVVVLSLFLSVVY